MRGALQVRAIQDLTKCAKKIILFSTYRDAKMQEEHRSILKNATTRPVSPDMIQAMIDKYFRAILEKIDALEKKIDKIKGTK
jgi:hypothetical protein